MRDRPCGPRKGWAESLLWLTEEEWETPVVTKPCEIRPGPKPPPAKKGKESMHCKNWKTGETVGGGEVKNLKWGSSRTGEGEKESIVQDERHGTTKKERSKT